MPKLIVRSESNTKHRLNPVCVNTCSYYTKCMWILKCLKTIQKTVFSKCFSIHKSSKKHFYKFISTQLVVKVTFYFETCFLKCQNFMDVCKH